MPPRITPRFLFSPRAASWRSIAPEFDTHGDSSHGLRPLIPDGDVMLDVELPFLTLAQNLMSTAAIFGLAPPPRQTIAAAPLRREY